MSMKKTFVLSMAFILILAMMFSIFSMNVAAVRIKESPVPLDPGADLFLDTDDDGTDDMTDINPKTGDNMLLLIILALISLPAVSTTVGVIKKSRVK